MRAGRLFLVFLVLVAIASKAIAASAATGSGFMVFYAMSIPGYMEKIAVCSGDPVWHEYKHVDIYLYSGLNGLSPTLVAEHPIRGNETDTIFEPLARLTKPKGDYAWNPWYTSMVIAYNDRLYYYDGEWHSIPLSNCTLAAKGVALEDWRKTITLRPPAAPGEYYVEIGPSGVGISYHSSSDHAYKGIELPVKLRFHVRVDNREVAALRYGGSTIVKLRYGDTLEIVPSIEESSGSSTVAGAIQQQIQQHKAEVGLGVLVVAFLVLARGVVG